jgi:hypothetical protein
VSPGHRESLFSVIVDWVWYRMKKIRVGQARLNLIQIWTKFTPTFERRNFYNPMNYLLQKMWQILYWQDFSFNFLGIDSHCIPKFLEFTEWAFPEGEKKLYRTRNDLQLFQ